MSVRLTFDELLLLKFVRAKKQSLQGLTPASTEVQVNANKYKVVEVLGRGAEGSVYRVKDNAGVSYTVKSHHTLGTLIAHEDLVAAQVLGAPTIIDSSTEIDRSNLNAKYRYVEGLPVNYILADQKLPESLRQKLRKFYEEWRRKYCRKTRSPCIPSNVLFEFKSKKLILIDAF